MDALRKQQLSDANINVDAALERFMGNEGLLEKFLNKFLADENYKKLTEAIAANDKEAALTASHTLKGVSGNLSMTKLFNLLTCQVGAIRSDDWQGAVDMMPDITKAYDDIIKAINGNS